jgi:hypothetical protein
MSTTPETLAFKVGDLVRATKTIFEEATDCNPRRDLCNAGDTLEVRKVGKFWAYTVAHPNREEGVGFGVHQDEIEPLSQIPTRAGSGEHSDPRGVPFLDEIQKRLDVVSAGPWVADHEDGSVRSMDSEQHEIDDGWVCDYGPAKFGIPWKDNGEFIAHSITDILRLVSALRWVQGASNEDLQSMMTYSDRVAFIYRHMKTGNGGHQE